VRDFYNAGKVVGAFCHGVVVLGTAGILSGKKVTSIPTIRPQLQYSGMREFMEPSDPFTACTDGNVVTGVSYMGTPAFLHSCIEAMGCRIPEAA
jgi:putative intracellular protease/amidase